MTEWVHTAFMHGSWETRKEQLGEYLLYCCRRPPGHVRTPGFPYGHVYVMHGENTKDKIVEHYRIEDDGPLEIECIAHEMREKYRP